MRNVDPLNECESFENGQEFAFLLSVV